MRRMRSALTLLLLLSSCTLAPTVIERSNPRTGSVTTVVSAGGSVLTKRAWEKRTVTRNIDGSITMEYETKGSDELGVVRIPAQVDMGTTAVGAIVPGLNAVTK